MWSWIFKVAVVSFLFIFLIHYLYLFFKTTLTSPKIKDLVNKPMRKYDSIYDSLQSSHGYMDDIEGINSSMNKILNSNPLSTQNPVKQNMKDELKKYLSELSGSGSGGANDINNNNNSNSCATSMPTSASSASSATPDFAMSSSNFSSSYSDF
jgi:hypothetical protein